MYDDKINAPLHIAMLFQKALGCITHKQLKKGFARGKLEWAGVLSVRERKN